MTSASVFAFCSVYQSSSSCQVKCWHQWFSRSYSSSKFDFIPFLGVVFFCYVFVTVIIFFCLPGFSKITSVILDEFWFCFCIWFSLPILIIVPSKTLVPVIFQELFQLKVRFYALFGGSFFSHFTKTFITFAWDMIEKILGPDSEWLVSYLTL